MAKAVSVLPVVLSISISTCKKKKKIGRIELSIKMNDYKKRKMLMFIPLHFDGLFFSILKVHLFIFLPGIRTKMRYEN